jgi:hypothetical protein
MAAPKVSAFSHLLYRNWTPQHTHYYAHHPEEIAIFQRTMQASEFWRSSSALLFLSGGLVCRRLGFGVLGFA